MHYCHFIITFSLFISLIFGRIDCHQQLKPYEAHNCAELWLKYDIRKSGNYTLKLSDDSQDLISVECDMSLAFRTYEPLIDFDLNQNENYFDIKTIIHHDSEETGLVQGFESPGSYSKNIKYPTVKSLSQIEKIINNSFTCQQYIAWKCKGSTFSFWYSKNHHSWWTDRHGRPQTYWGNAEPDSYSCGCFPYCDSTTKNSTCNCDANLKTEWLEDSGMLLIKDRLPVTQLHFGDTGEMYEGGRYTLGPLICRSYGHRLIEMGNFKAPVTLTSPGYLKRYPPEFRRYRWRVLAEKGQLIEMVFLDYDMMHFGAYNSVPACKNAIKIDFYQRKKETTAFQNEFDVNDGWIKLGSIERKKFSPPYYVTDGIDSILFVIEMTTCNQNRSIINDHKGFKVFFRQSKCASCNGIFFKNTFDENVGEQKWRKDCLVAPDQCIYIYSNGYPFPHYLNGDQRPKKNGIAIEQHWNISTSHNHILEIEFNDFDVISTPGQHYCDADLLTVQKWYNGSLQKSLEYCNINRFNIGKLGFSSNHMKLYLKTILTRVGNSRGIHATIHSIPKSIPVIKWVSNAAEGKPADQSTTRGTRDSMLAVDGNFEQRNQEKCSSTNYEREPWWRVNLQKRHRIYGIKIYSYISEKQSPLLQSSVFESENFRTCLKRWPMGNYALPMPVSGCPYDFNRTWLTGMRFHAVQHDKPYDDKTQYWSENIMLKGGATGKGTEQHFCIHNETFALNSSSGWSMPNLSDFCSWQPGKYCILQYGEFCPDGFQSGLLTWLDKNESRTDSTVLNFFEGFMPRGKYTPYNTTIHFCCREDGDPEKPIYLPQTRPFYLFQYGQICQEVAGMSELEQFFHYEEEVATFGSSLEYVFANGAQLKFQDPHPRIEVTIFDRGLTLHYCYYDIADKLKGFQVLVDTTPETFGYGRFYDKETGMSRPVSKPFLSAVECVSYNVTSDEFDQITLNCIQPVEGQYVIIFMKDRQDALQLCEVVVFGEESCGRPLGMATEEILDSAITSSSFDSKKGLIHHPYNVRLNSFAAWCAANNDQEKFIQVDLRLHNSNAVFDMKTVEDGNSTWNSVNYLTIVGIAMQGMPHGFKSYFVTHFQVLFSNDSTHWTYEEEPIGKQKIYRCVQCEAQHVDPNEVVLYNLLKPVVARFIRVKIISFRGGPCMRLELIGCRGDKKNWCSKTLTATTPGVISSPNYPFYYAQHKSCEWTIKPATTGRHIELDFIVLDLALAERGVGKCQDHLLIYHSPSQSAITIGSGSNFIQNNFHFREKAFPKKIISNGQVTLVLKTCFRFSMSRYQGFLLRFRETDCPGCGIGDSKCSKLHNCTSLCGRIFSINYPLNYTDNYRCQWLIKAPEGHYFNITIEDFDVADASVFTPKGQQQQRVKTCLFDHLSFTDASTGMLFGRYCNSNKPPKNILSNWNELLIEFSTDSSKTGRGFKLKYQAQRYELLPETRSLLISPLNACPPRWLYFRGYCYSAFVESEALQWHEAEEKCAQKFKGRDGHLVSIMDHLEMNVLHYWIIEQWKIVPHHNIYIGLIDTNREGFYNWSDGNPMSYTDWYRSNLFSVDPFTINNYPQTFEPKNWSTISYEFPDYSKSTLNLNGDLNYFNQFSQPDGGAYEDCTVINFHSIYSTLNWHDIPCSLGKKVMPVKKSIQYQGNSNNITNIMNQTVNSGFQIRRLSPNSNVNDGLIRNYICKMDSNSSMHQHGPRKILFQKLISDSEKESVRSRIDSNRYFVCNNYEVISIMFRCDGAINCRDGSDETESCPLNENCLPSQFQCANGHCISIGKYCDFIDDCGDSSDEQCNFKPCKKNIEFQCNNGQCIPQSKRCDLFHDCRDQSDENTCNGKCHLNTTFQCYFGICIPLYALCDKHRDCPGKFFEDEHESVCSVLLNQNSSQDENSSPFWFETSSMARSISLQARPFPRWRRGSSISKSKPLEEMKKQRRNIVSCPVAGGLKKKKFKQSCQDLLDFHGIISDGYYELEPIPSNKLTLMAYCRFLNRTLAMTIINHDTEDRLYVRSAFNAPGSFIRSITYEGNFDLIVEMIDLSASCRQSLSYECSGSRFNFNSSKPNSWWISRNGQREFSWGGSHQNACACYPECVSNLRCNCDAGLMFNWTRDYGNITDRSKLPIIQVAIGDVYHIGQLGYVQVGPLECSGRADLNLSIRFDEPTECFNQTDNAKVFQCNSGQVVDSKHICLYEFDQLGYQIGCRDVSHLRNCEKYECPPDYVKCPDSYCIPFRYICNDKWDCVGGSDEIGCSRYSCPGRYKCAKDSSCVLLHQLCDGIRHCPLGDDEWFCDLTCPESCVCTGLFVNCQRSNMTLAALKAIPKVSRKLDLSWTDLGPDLSSIDFNSFTYLGELILQHNQIEIIRSRKFIELTNLYKLDLRHNHIKVIEGGAFAGLEQVTRLMLEHNPYLTEIQSGAFVGLTSLRRLNISNTNLSKIQPNVFLQMNLLNELTLAQNKISTIEKGAFNDLSSLVSLNLRGNSIQNFSKDMFINLKSLRHLSTDSFKFCCLASGIVSFDRCYPQQDEISDCEDLLSNTVQRLILWVLGFTAFFGNLWVVIWRYKTRSISAISSTLILSLGVSDFLMGIYLLFIASVDEYYRGRYIENSDYWKNSVWCQFCGFLSTISSEMSVITLVLITFDRLISISFTFSPYRFTVKSTNRLLLLTWVLSFLISVIPLLPVSYFKRQFYSRSGVCLAFHITTIRWPGWEYSVAIFLVFNLLAFLFILVCYCYMYKTITASIKKRRQMRAKELRETKTGAQMALIVITNFLCWFPVIIMGFMALSGVTIPGIAYSWIAVLVLPVNSAINPLIYTLMHFIPNMLGNKKQLKNQQQQLLMTHQNHQRTLSVLSYNHQQATPSSIKTDANETIFNFSTGHKKQQHSIIIEPPPGYQTLNNFMRNNSRPITPEHLLQICQSISRWLKDYHNQGIVFGIITFETIFVTTKSLDSNDGSYQVMAYISPQNSYKAVPFATIEPEQQREIEDFHNDIIQFGQVVKRMLQQNHIRKIKQQTEER